ncbi:MAG: hypothetical protein EZS26_003690, partial [Candidatus Ordinivivax streblomastigis]
MKRKDKELRELIGTTDEENSFSVITNFEGGTTEGEPTIEINPNDKLPILPLRNMVLFPGVFVPV